MTRYHTESNKNFARAGGQKKTLRSRLVLVAIITTYFSLSCLLVNMAQATSYNTEQQQMLDMINQLDQLDKMDFEDAVDKASNCIFRRNFQCAQNELNTAATYANGSDDLNILQLTKRDMSAEILTVQIEIEEERLYQEEQRRLEKQIRREEQRRQQEEEYAAEEAEAEAEEYEREQQEYARRQFWAEDDNSPNLGLMMMESMQSAANDITNLQNQLNRDTNQAIRQANQINAENQRRKEAAAREQRLAQQREHSQQQAYERAQREKERERQAKQRYEQKKRDLEQKQQQRKMEREDAARRAETLRKERLERVRQEREEKKQREREEKERNQNLFLSAMTNGISLSAKKCFGETHVGGQRPAYSGGNHNCIDVYFTATCPNETGGTSGVLETMTMMSGSGCYGDTVKIPKASCNEKLMNVTVDRVVFCGQ